MVHQAVAIGWRYKRAEPDYHIPGMLMSPPGTMLKDPRIYSLPRWPITRWLVDAGPDVPPDIRLALIASLFVSIPGGVTTVSTGSCRT